MDIQSKAKDAVLKKLKNKMMSAMYEDSEEMPMEDMEMEAEAPIEMTEIEMEASPEMDSEMTEEMPMEDMEMSEESDMEMPYVEMPDGTFKLETTDPEIIEKVKMALDKDNQEY